MTALVRWFAVWILLLLPAAAAASNLEFSLHKLESEQAHPTLLVFGGIQGDEPGGFNAASLLVTHYEIQKGSVWVVPNLNFVSIVRKSRGVHGDLNRKFSDIEESDPEYATIQKIKSLILSKPVEAVLNLHDGSGFYRHTYQDALHSPHRWGQSIIIDQERLEKANGPAVELEQIAASIANEVNQALLSEEHAYRVKNTRTRDGNIEMSKTLTYFAVCNKKAAFGLEASKSFPTHVRTYYHLLAMESFMRRMGIRFHRRFPLGISGVKEAIDKNVQLAFYDHKIFLDVWNARNRLRYLPLKKNAPLEFTPSNPLIALVASDQAIGIFHGNRRVTNLYPQYFDYDSSIEGISIHIDGHPRQVDFGEVVRVDRSFRITPRMGYRVNVIGFRKEGPGGEAGIEIHHEDIEKRFSIDTDGSLFRVEVYRQDRFSGMVLVHFDKEAASLGRTASGKSFPFASHPQASPTGPTRLRSLEPRGESSVFGR
ncbi:MAG: succinylglutamate desuccinylase/aspartoacylase family protein [Desulfobacteraceae bacterium]|nr:succinylglutamate desuccinylase/aspartoacylase family protein [Desulfobacteraceae bacterium]